MNRPPITTPQPAQISPDCTVCGAAEPIIKDGATLYCHDCANALLAVTLAMSPAHLKDH